jgi:hypothetical protein
MLITFLFLLCAYLFLIRQNRAASYKRGIAAIDKALEFWPSLVADIETMRNRIVEEFGQENPSPLRKQKLINALDLMTVKQRERIVLASGVKVSVYAKISVYSNKPHMMPMPGNNYPSKSPKDIWLPSTVEVIAAEQDMLLADFIAKSGRPVWALDSIEVESRLTSNPGVISWTLLVNAPGGYERSISWVSQLLLMQTSLLLLLVPAYVRQDARGRYRRAILWTAIAAATNIIGLLAYLLIGRVADTTCFECGQPTNEDQKFCPYCKTLLKTECLNCGQALSRNWRFCVACGAKPES